MLSWRWSGIVCAGRVLVGASALMLAQPVAEGAEPDAERAARAAYEPDAEQAARAAYERGTAAFANGDFAVAAKAYAEADELSPNAVALESALKAVIRADDPALGMTLVERAESVTDASRSLTSLARLGREKFEERAGQVTFLCPAPADCNATLDGVPTETGAPRWVATGAHQVEISAYGRSEYHDLVVAAGGNVEVNAPSAPPPPAPPRPPPQQDATGISPVWFWVAAGATVIAGGATIASGVDAVSQHDAYLEHPNARTESDGRAAETRTNVLLGITGAAAVATAALGLFAVRWSGAPDAHTGLVMTPHGARLTTELRF